MPTHPYFDTEAPSFRLMTDTLRSPQSADAKKPGCLLKASTWMHDRLEGFFGKLTELVVHRPWLTVLITVLLTVVLFQGVHLREEELSAEKQFTPQDSQAVDDEEWVNSHFGHQDRTGDIMFYTSSEDGDETSTNAGNVLKKTALLKALKYYEWFQNDVTAEYDGQKFKYHDVCSRTVSGDKKTPCLLPRSVLALWDYNAAVLTADVDHMGTINNETRWREVFPTGAGVAHYLSSHTERAADDSIVASPSFKIAFKLKNFKRKVSGEGDKDPESKEFELELFDQTEDQWADRLRAEDGMSVAVDASGPRDDAGNKATSKDVSSLLIGYVLMIGYTTIVLSRRRLKFSHGLLGMVSVLSVGLATASSYGLAWYIGIKYNNVVSVLILVLLGIGVDDAFVIMDSWWDEAHIPDMKERMITAMRHAGPAITITSVTDLIAFLCGATTVLPALRDFCYYASLGIFFDFAFQCTFFVAITFVDSRRQDRGKADCCVCVGVEDDRGRFGTVPPASNGKPFKEGARPLVAKLIGEKLPVLVLGNPVGKAVVLLVAATFIGIGIWGLTDLRMNFNVEWFVPSDSDMQRALDVRDHHFKGVYIPVSMYAGTMEDNYPKYQEHLETYTRTFEKGEWVVDGSATSWYREFIEWVGETEPASVTTVASGIKIVAESRFYPLLRRYTTFGVGPRSAMSHARNLRWNNEEVKDRLKASKINFMIKSGPAEDGQTAVDAMDSLRDSVEYSNPKLIAFTHPFIFWEGYRIMLREMLRNVIMAGAAVFILVSLLLANIQMGAYIVLSIAAVDTCLLGFMPIIGVEVNSVSVICIVIAVGLAVDYSVHIGGAFLKIDAQCNGYHSPKTQRAAHALWKMGPAVVNGGFSTFLAVLPLCVAKSYVFKVFFRMFCLIILFGQFFGVFVVPVLLSFAGPAPVVGATHLSCAPWTSPLDPLFKHEDPASPTASPTASPGSQVSPKQLPPVPVIENEMRPVAAYEPPAGMQARGEPNAEYSAQYRTTNAPNIQVI